MGGRDEVVGEKDRPSVEVGRRIGRDFVGYLDEDAAFVGVAFVDVASVGVALGGRKESDGLEEEELGYTLALGNRGTEGSRLEMVAIRILEEVHTRMKRVAGVVHDEDDGCHDEAVACMGLFALVISSLLGLVLRGRSILDTCP